MLALSRAGAHLPTRRVERCSERDGRDTQVYNEAQAEKDWSRMLAPHGKGSGLKIGSFDPREGRSREPDGVRAQSAVPRVLYRYRSGSGIRLTSLSSLPVNS